MTNKVEQELNHYLFPVGEREVFIDDEKTYKPTKHYKAIVREDNGKLISIMKDTYQLVPNQEVILPLVDELSKFDSKWIVDPSHSFVANDQFRLMITFPELTFSDGKSDIALSLFLTNSYNGASAVKLIFGSIRLICSNGAIYGHILRNIYRKHTSGFEVNNLREQIESTYNKIPVIKHRIEILQNTNVTKKIRREVEDRLGKHIINYVTMQEKQFKRAADLWTLYNMITFYISHKIRMDLRQQYQVQVSRLFKL